MKDSLKNNLKVCISTETDNYFIVDITKISESNPTLIDVKNKNHHLIDEYLNAEHIKDENSYSVYETDDYKFLVTDNNKFGIVADVVQKESPQKDQYALLNRLQRDCEYFLGHRNRFVGHLYYDSVEKHIEEMKKLWNCLRLKPEWLSMQEIEEYENKMLNDSK